MRCRRRLDAVETGRSGYGLGMSEKPDEEAVEARAHLLPEEVAAGSDDPEAQAVAILEESEERTLYPVATRHESSQTPDEAGVRDSGQHLEESHAE